jgi:lysozyme
MITNLLDQLKRDEGLRLTPYRCTAGKLTIGYGRNLDDVGISKEEAEFLLASDVAKVRIELPKHLPWMTALTPPRQAVLVNMAFNMGIAGGLLKFKNTLRLIETGEYAEAAKAMLDSKWAEQTGQRALRLSVQLNTGEWQ